MIIEVGSLSAYLLSSNLNGLRWFAGFEVGGPELEEHLSADPEKIL